MTGIGVVQSETWLDVLFHYTGLIVWLLIILTISHNLYVCAKWATHDTRWALKHKLPNVKYYRFIGYWFRRFLDTLTNRLSGITRVG